MTEPGDDMRERVADALGRAMTDDVVTRWVALVEVIDGDGERGIWTLTHDGATAWDTLGMLSYATQLEQARTVARDLEEE